MEIPFLLCVKYITTYKLCTYQKIYEIMYITLRNVSTDCCCEWQDGTFCSFFIIFIKLLENVQSSLTFFLYDRIILREKTLKKNSFLSLENVKDKPPLYRQERRQGGGFAMHKFEHKMAG